MRLPTTRSRTPAPGPGRLEHSALERLQLLGNRLPLLGVWLPLLGAWLLLLGAWLPLLGACRSNPYGDVKHAQAGAFIDAAEADIQAGEFQRALERLAAVRDVENLDPDLRVREERLIDTAARARFAELAEAPSGELEAMFDSELPVRVRARAGVLAASRMLEEDSRVSAYRMVKKVDERLPGHPERVLGGDVLARAGLSLIRDDGRYGLLFSYSARGVQALEYLVVRYPLDPRCPEAYFRLSEAYEHEDDLDQAVARTEDLLLYHPDSAFAVAAGTRLPYLRLLRLRRDDYDRAELLRARGELTLWLDQHAGHELAEWSAELLQQCDTRLVRNDLYLASFYERTHSPEGVRLHAGRARALASERGLEKEAEAARRLLASLPSEEQQPALPAALADEAAEAAGPEAPGIDEP